MALLHPLPSKPHQSSLSLLVLRLSHSKDELRRPLHRVILPQDFWRFSQVLLFCLPNGQHTSSVLPGAQSHGCTPSRYILRGPVQTARTLLGSFLSGVDRLSRFRPNLCGQQRIQSDQNQREGAAAGMSDYMLESHLNLQ